MKTAFLKFISWMKNLWRTVVSTFCKRHLYLRDVDQDNVDEIVVDINGIKEKQDNIDKDKEESL